MKLSISRETFHQYVYLFGIAFLVCCLPLSRYLLSIAQFLLAANWIAEGNFRNKVKILLQKPALLLLMSLFLVYALGLLYSQHVAAGLLKIKNILPVLLLPLVMITSKPLSEKQIKWLLLLFSGAVMAAAMVGMIAYFANRTSETTDFRGISVFMLHIRFSLLIVMSIFILLYYALYKKTLSSNRERLAYIVAACLLTAFLFFLRSMTGIVIFGFLSVVFILNLAIRYKRPLLRNALLMIVFASVVAVSAIIIFTYYRNFSRKKADMPNLEQFTANGNPYNHQVNSGILENGYYTDIYICEPELQEAWNRISTIPYDQTDRKGQAISGTIKRYLSSLGLRKDSAAISKLGEKDIRLIENGIANCRFHENPGLYQRLYETLWEIQIFHKTGYVQQHSLGQRLAFMKIATVVIRNHPWTGVGTGDVYDAMVASARASEWNVEPRWEGKPHNQYLFYLLAFGIPGFLWIMFSLLYAAILSRSYCHLLFNIYAGILLLSMLTLDTLESYDSIVFFSFFFSLFALPASPHEK